MWIIPSNHPLSSAFAQECVASNEDWTELLSHYGETKIEHFPSETSMVKKTEKVSQLPLMWRSKPLSSSIWSGKWKKVYWLRHLSGRTLKPSREQHFTAKYTASLAVIPANPLAWQDSEKEQKTQDTFFHIYAELSKQLSLFGASSKTWTTTYPWDMTKFTEAYTIWVTHVRQESTQRVRWAHLMNENDYSYSPSKEDSLPTPTLTELTKGARILNEDGKNVSKTTGQTFGITLNQKVKWQTPTASTGDYQNQKDGSIIFKLQGQVKWATPNTMDILPSRSYAAMKAHAQHGARKNRERPSNLREQMDPNMIQAYQEAKEDNNPTLKLNWSTPRVGGQEGYETRLARGKDMGLQGEVEYYSKMQKWPTPAARDTKGANGDDHFANKERPHLDQLPNKMKQYYQTEGDSTGGQPHPEGHNTTGNVPILNPEWVLQLMGTTIETTFSEWQEMA